MDELGAGLLPEPEFRTILAAHFREITQPAPQVITYGRNDDTVLLARYKDGRLRRVAAGPALKPDDINAVAARVRAEAAETREHVHRSIVFSPRRPAGFWRFADRFQLLPAPLSAPDTLGLAPHPLVLEFKVRWSADTTLSTMRWTDTETRLVLLLNALLRFGLTHTGFRTRQQWVIAMEHPDGHPAPVTTRTIYARDGYAFPDFTATAEDFSDTSHLLEIPALSPGEPHSADFTAPLQIPSYLEPGVACYYALTGTDRDVFHRSLYWLSVRTQASAVYPASFSAAFAALVQTIEALAGQPGPVIHARNASTTGRQEPPRGWGRHPRPGRGGPPDSERLLPDPVGHLARKPGPSR